MLIVVTGFAWFFGTEHLYKFDSLKEHYDTEYPCSTTLSYTHGGGKEFEKGMYTLRIQRTSDGGGFSVLVFVVLSFPWVPFGRFPSTGWDPYAQHTLEKDAFLISTYLGKRSTDLRFNVQHCEGDTFDIELVGKSGGWMKHDQICPPHWYQKWLNFFG